jgi:hypothetical protein
MEQWSGVQRAFPVKAYYKNGSVEPRVEHFGVSSISDDMVV